jgi:hypothetical protein
VYVDNSSAVYTGLKDGRIIRMHRINLTVLGKSEGTVKGLKLINNGT